MRFLYAIFFLFVCCSSPNRTNSKVLSLATTISLPSLDPKDVVSNQTGFLLGMIGETLFKKNQEIDIIPHFCHSYSVEDNGRIYRFVLKKGCWSDGEPIQARDFAAGWLRLISTRSHSKGKYKKIFKIKNAKEYSMGMCPKEDVGIRIVDQRTIEIELEEKDPKFILFFSEVYSIPIPTHVIGENPAVLELDKLPVSGPFFVEKLTPRECIVSRNRKYWDVENVSLEKIQIQFECLEETALMLFEKGEIDWFGDPFNRISEDAFEYIRSQYPLRENLSTDIKGFLIFNEEVAPFSDREFRKTIQAVIYNRLSIENSHFHMIEPNFDFYIHDDQTERTLKRLSKEWGRKKKVPFPSKSLTITYPSSTFYNTIAQVIQDELSVFLDTKIILQPLEWKVFLDLIQKNKFDIAIMQLSYSNTEDIELMEVFQKKSGGALGRLQNQSYDSIVQGIMSIDSSILRKGMMAQGERVLQKHLPVIPLYRIRRYYVTQNNLSHVQNHGSYIDFTYLSKE